MRLYLMRHGKAEFGPEDADRRLSARGREDVNAVAAYLGGQDIAVSKVVHSTLARARETAEIVSAQIAPGVELEEMEGIEPWGNVKAFASVAETWTDDTLVCGHEPFMGEAASYLLTGNPHGGLVEVKTGSIMSLSRGPYGDGWQLRWMMGPRLVRGAKKEED